MMFLDMMCECDRLKVTAIISANDHFCWENHRKAKNNTNKIFESRFH